MAVPTKAERIIECCDVLTQREMAEQFDTTVAYVRSVLKRSAQNAASVAHHAEKSRHRRRLERSMRR